MIKYYRKSRRLTQSELSKKSGIDLYVIQKIENKRTSPTLEQVVKLADALEIDKYRLANDLIRNMKIECANDFFNFF